MSTPDSEYLFAGGGKQLTDSLRLHMRDLSFRIRPMLKPGPCQYMLEIDNATHSINLRLVETWDHSDLAMLIAFLVRVRERIKAGPGGPEPEAR